MNQRTALSSVVAAMVVCGIFTGCNDSDSEVRIIAGTGHSVVRGNVSECNVETVPGAVAQAWVRLDGTDIEGPTDKNGMFYFSGVPAGDYTIIIEYNGVEVKIDIQVQDRTEVIIRDIIMNEDGTVEAKIIVKTQVKIQETAPEPINVTGTYAFNKVSALPGEISPGKLMTLTQSGTDITGTIADDIIPAVGPTYYALIGTINDNTVTITGTSYIPAISTTTLNLTGTVDDSGNITGTYTDTSGDNGTWSAEPYTIL
ncbi:MAG: hypothetical protein JXN60_07545 [Lentisphaerae bacterium]|nr:hypothetical protein [Lentisphaerota bacterium]